MRKLITVIGLSLLTLLSVVPAFADYSVLPTKVPANVFLRDGTKPMTGPLDLGDHRITNVTNPSANQDVATKSYADAVASGLNLKQSVRGATTANITLSGEQTVDGVVLVAGNRELVKNQSTASANGIYVVSAGAWTRATDADISAEVTGGMFTFVEEGTVNADQGWVLATNNPIVLGTTALSFAQFSAAGSITAGNGLTQTGPSFDVVGTAGRISVSADAVDIDPTYVASIAQGGTAATTAAGAPFALKGVNTDLTALTQAGVLSSGTEIYSGAGTFTATGNNGLVSCSGGSTATLNLPAYVVNRKLTLKVRSAAGSSSGLLTVARQGSDQILVNGSFVTSTTISSYQTATFQSFDGSLIGFPGLTVWMRVEPAILPVAQGGTGSQYYGIPFRGMPTNNYNVTLDDYLVMFQIDLMGAGPFAATIPNPSTTPAGKEYMFFTGGNSATFITITSPGNGFVDSNGNANAFPSFTLAMNESIRVFNDGAYWRINKILPIDRGGTGATTAAGAPFALKGANTDLSSVTLTAPSTMSAGASGVMLSGRAATNGTDDALRLFYGPDGTTSLFYVDAYGTVVSRNGFQSVGSFKHYARPGDYMELSHSTGGTPVLYLDQLDNANTTDFLRCRFGGGYSTLYSVDYAGGIHSNLGNDVVGQTLTLSSGQTADAINVTTNGGTAGDRLKLSAAGLLTVPSLSLGTALPTGSGGTGLTAPGTAGNVLTSNGSIWTSAAPASQLPQGFTGDPVKRQIFVQPQSFAATSYTGSGGPSGGSNLGTAAVAVNTGAINGLMVVRQSTTTTTNDKSGMRWNDTSSALIPDAGYKMTATIVTGPDITNTRIWVNVSSDNSGFKGSSLVGTYGTGFRYDTSASDTTWQFCSSDAGTQQVSNTTMTVAPNTTYTFYWYGNTTTSTGTVNGSAPVTNSTNNPVAGSSMSFQTYVENLASAVRTIYVSRSYGEN